MARRRMGCSRWCFVSFRRDGRSCTTTRRRRSKTRSAPPDSRRDGGGTARDLLHSYLYSRAFGESSLHQLHYSVADDSFEFVPRDSGSWRRLRGRGRPRHMARAFVHRFVCQAVGFLVVLAEGMADGEPVQLVDQFFGTRVQILQREILDLVNAFNLSHQQFGVADQLEGFGAMLQRVFEGGDQALILREVVGLVAEIFAERGDPAAGRSEEHTSEL